MILILIYGFIRHISKNIFFGCYYFPVILNGYLNSCICNNIMYEATFYVINYKKLISSELEVTGDRSTMCAYHHVTKNDKN
jgi:hypothetical protein